MGYLQIQNGSSVGVFCRLVRFLVQQQLHKRICLRKMVTDERWTRIGIKQLSAHGGVDIEVRCGQGQQDSVSVNRLGGALGIGFVLKFAKEVANANISKLQRNRFGRPAQTRTHQKVEDCCAMAVSDVQSSLAQQQLLHKAVAVRCTIHCIVHNRDGQWRSGVTIIKDNRRIHVGNRSNAVRNSLCLPPLTHKKHLHRT